MLTMIGGDSTEAEGTSEKGMIVRSLVNGGNRRKPAFTGMFPLSPK